MPKGVPFSRDSYFKLLDDWLKPTPLPTEQGDLLASLRERIRQRKLLGNSLPNLPRPTTTTFGES